MLNFLIFLLSISNSFSFIFIILILLLKQSLFFTYIQIDADSNVVVYFDPGSDIAGSQPCTYDQFQFDGAISSR